MKSVRDRRYRIDGEAKSLRDINFRTMIYAYLAQHPEATKGQIAERLHIAPLTLSRAIAGKNLEDTPVRYDDVISMLKEIDFFELERDIFRMKDAKKLYEKKERYITITPILKSYAFPGASEFETEVSDSVWFDYLVECVDGRKAYAEEIDATILNTAGFETRFRSCCEHLSRSKDVGKLIFVSYNTSTLRKLTKDDNIETAQRYLENKALEAIQIDLERQKIVEAVTIIEPVQIMA